MKFYKYLMIVSLLFGFSVQAHESNEDGMFLTCVNREDVFDCIEINLTTITTAEYRKDKAIFHHRYFGSPRNRFSCEYDEYDLIEGSQCQNIQADILR